MIINKSSTNYSNIPQNKVNINTKNNCQIKKFESKNKIENIKNIIYLLFINFLSNKYHFNVLKNLGEGGYGQVNEIQIISNNNIYAHKIASVKEDNSTIESKKSTYYKNELLNREKALSKTIKNKCIIKTLATFTDFYKYNDENYTIHSFIMEKSSYGNLNKFIQIFNKGFICRNTINPNQFNIKWIFNLSEITIKKFINDVIEGMQYIKLANLVHFDIKPENILLFKDYNLKICDFSLLKIINRDSEETDLNYSTFVYQDPTVYNKEKKIETKYIHKIDLFSVGCIIYFMIFKKFLIDKKLKNYNNLENMKEEVNKCIKNGIENIKNSTDISKSLKTLMVKLLEPNIKERIDLNEVSQNEFLNSDLNLIEKSSYSNYNEQYKPFIEFQKINALKCKDNLLKRKRKKFNF
jgi:serine/threonine protein kinase